MDFNAPSKYTGKSVTAHSALRLLSSCQLRDITNPNDIFWVMQILIPKSTLLEI